MLLGSGCLAASLARSAEPAPLLTEWIASQTNIHTWSADLVHEKVVADGPVVRLRGDLLHASAESIDAYIAKQNRYTTVQATAMHARGERASILQLVLSPGARFLRFYVLRLGFLDGAAGFAHIAIGAFASFLKYAKLRALQSGGRTR